MNLFSFLFPGLREQQAPVNLRPVFQYTVTEGPATKAKAKRKRRRKLQRQARRISRAQGCR